MKFKNIFKINDIQIERKRGIFLNWIKTVG